MSDLSVYIPRAEDGLVEFKLFDASTSNQPSKDKGILALAQRAVLTVLRSLGDDSFSPNYGGSIKDLVGRSLIMDESLMRADAILIVEQSEAMILAEQAEFPIPNPELMLDSLEFVNFYFDEVDPTNMVLEFNVKNQTGDIKAVKL